MKKMQLVQIILFQKKHLRHKLFTNSSEMQFTIPYPTDNHKRSYSECFENEKKPQVFVRQVIYSRGAMNVKLKFKDFEVLLCVVILHALKTVYNLSAMALPTGENGSSGLGIT